jgi:MFS family permease
VTVPSQQPTRSSTATSAALSAASTEPSIGQLAADASTQLSTIIRGEVELAKLELTASVKKAGIGAAMFAAAGVILAYSLTFGLISLAEGIHSLGLWRWLSYLIVFAVLVILAVILVFVGLRLIKKVKSPERTIATTKDTVAYLKHPTKA